MIEMRHQRLVGLRAVAPTVLVVPEGVNVRKVDLGQELQILAYHEYRARVDDLGVPR